MCDEKPQANCAIATKPAVQVGDEYEIRVRVTAIDTTLPYAYSVVAVNDQTVTDVCQANILAAGRLVASRPLAVGDRVNNKGTTRPPLGTIKAVCDGRAWVAWDAAGHSLYHLVDLVRV